MLWILLPAFNEEKALSTLIPKINTLFQSKSTDYRLVVVNDGSTDRTLEILNEFIKSSRYPLHILSHKINRGLGETERDGFEFIAENASRTDVVVRLDSDDTHEPTYVFDLVKKLNEGFDVVNTSRFQPGGSQMGVNNYRTLMSYCANVFMRLIFQIPGVRDYSCGFRAYRASVIQDALSLWGNSFIQLKGLGFTSTLEMLVKLKLLGCTFAEVPFTLRYDQKPSESKMVSSITTLGYIIMAICYHWPMGGWRSVYKNIRKSKPEERAMAIQKFRSQKRQKTLFVQH